MMEIEIILQKDGSLVIPRGNSQQNELLSKVLEEIVDIKLLSNFFYISAETDVVFGNSALCG